MTKKDVQNRVLKCGRKLSLSKFSWNARSSTLTTREDGLVIDFRSINGVTFNTGSGCTFNTGYGCTFRTGSGCTFRTGSDCTFNTGSDCTFRTGYGCTFKTGYYGTFRTGYGCTFKTGYGCTFKTGDDCTFKTSFHCTFNTSFNCTFNTGWNCTFNTGSGCTFRTGYDCTFNTGNRCTFNTGNRCTFNTGNRCTFNTGDDCVIVRLSPFEVHISNGDSVITLAPKNVPGCVKDGIYSETGKPAIIADGILSEIIRKKSIKGLTVYKVINYGKSEPSYLIHDGEHYSHGSTVKDAIDSLSYKIRDRDTSVYDNHTLESTLTKAEAIKMYRCMTGACEEGTKYFVKNLASTPESLTIKELIELTSGQYGNEILIKRFC